jgi:hypothetical protein
MPAAYTHSFQRHSISNKPLLFTVPHSIWADSRYRSSSPRPFELCGRANARRVLRHSMHRRSYPQGPRIMKGTMFLTVSFELPYNMALQEERSSTPWLHYVPEPCCLCYQHQYRFRHSNHDHAKRLRPSRDTELDQARRLRNQGWSAHQFLRKRLSVVHSML